MGQVCKETARQGRPLHLFQQVLLLGQRSMVAKGQVPSQAAGSQWWLSAPAEVAEPPCASFYSSHMAVSELNSITGVCPPKGGVRWMSRRCFPVLPSRMLSSMQLFPFPL